AIDLIVVDHHLPGGASGLELYREVRAAGRDVPAILVTAFSDEATVLQALRAGVTDFVPKTPNYLEHLLPAVERVLRERRTEKQLAESRAELAGIIESALDAVVTVGEAGRILIFNPAAEETFGCPAAEARGQMIDRFLPHWREVLATCAPPGAPAGGRQFCHAETDGRRADGRSFPVELSLSRGPRLAFWTCIARDLTERRRAQQEHYRLL